MVSPAERARHIDNVFSMVARPEAEATQTVHPEATPLYRSWARCVTTHGLDPARPTPARILPQQQVREHRERLDDFLRVARSGMEDMYSRVADLGYMLLLTDAAGITVDYIGNPSQEDELRGAGLYLGADWNEAHAGTCGVGTCLIERRPITCHQAEHFDATHIALTCSSAPLFDPTGELLAVLDVSALRSPVGRDSQHLAFQLACMYAQRIEDANFLRHFRRHWILRLGRGAGLVDVSGEVIFAFDEDGVIAGANSGARARAWGMAGLPGQSPVGRSLFELFPAAADGIWRLAREGRGIDEIVLGGEAGRRWYATASPPRERWRESASALGRGVREAVDAVQARRVGVSGGAASLCNAGMSGHDGDAMPAGAVPRDARLGHAGAQSAARDDALAIGPVAARSPRAPQAPRHPTLDRLAGDDPAMTRLVAQVRRLASWRMNVLVHGETGAGKEVLARAIHAAGPRAERPFVAINCAAIPDSLIESELFGYLPGSFTGGRAKGARGLIQQADGGTLFLDEIGDMPLHLQTRLLRVISEGEVLPIGADKPVPVDLAIVAATHRELRERVAAGTFREDLYYRLAGATLRLPALRDRADRQWLIAQLYADEAAAAGGHAGITEAALARLLAHDWPGNLRELRNVLRLAIVYSGAGPVEAEHLPEEVGAGGMRSGARAGMAGGAGRSGVASGPGIESDAAHPHAPDDGASAGASSIAAGFAASRRAPAAGHVDASAVSLGDGDVHRLVEALRRNRWNVSTTARELAICRATIYRQMKRHGIVSPNHQ
ncbi:sigma-54-dependent Fis family transcriptional regulator [Derxia gummosa]|uniref:Sigma-54-dependent Fis family transcriptional regulator n=1 Tax=Derxia gummosa DSM 723 TaxID=1121388 RepID=A0A9U5CMF5_9BURK|nr:sigma 54-interacting transcriptional regulator [Derxia gummosa]